MLGLLFRIILSVSFLILHLAAPSSSLSQESLTTAALTVELPAKDKFRIVVLAGQSNMAGRGFIEPEDKIPIPRVYMLDREGKWTSAVDPVHYENVQE